MNWSSWPTRMQHARGHHAHGQGGVPCFQPAQHRPRGHARLEVRQPRDDRVRPSSSPCGARFSDRVTGQALRVRAARRRSSTSTSTRPRSARSATRCRSPSWATSRACSPPSTSALAKAGAKPIDRTLARPDRRVGARRCPFYHSRPGRTTPDAIVPEMVMQQALAASSTPRHSIVVTEVGQHQMWAAPVHRPRERRARSSRPAAWAPWASASRRPSALSHRLPGRPRWSAWPATARSR